jgi:hypothetical protein
MWPLANRAFRSASRLEHECSRQPPFFNPGATSAPYHRRLLSSTHPPAICHGGAPVFVAGMCPDVSRRAAPLPTGRAPLRVCLPMPPVVTSLHLQSDSCRHASQPHTNGTRNVFSESRPLAAVIKSSLETIGFGQQHEPWTRGCACTACNPHQHHCCAPAGRCVITFKSDQFRQSNLSSCNLKGRLGTAVPPGSSVVLDRASDTLVPCTPLLCPYAIPSARDSNVLVNFVPISTPMIVTYLPSPSLAVDNSAALGAFASRNTAHDQEYRQAFTDALLPRQPPASTPPEPGVSDAAIAAAVAAVAHQSIAIATPSVAINPQPFLRLGYDLRDTVAMLQPYAEMLAFNNSFRGIPCPGVSYFRCAAVAAPSPACSFGCTHLTPRSMSRRCDSNDMRGDSTTASWLHVY